MKTPDTILIEVPKSALVNAFLEKIQRASEPAEHPADTIRIDTIDAMPRIQEACAALPAIGSAYRDGIFAGLTLHNDLPAALVVLEGDADPLDWDKARAWAAKQGGDLPSRIDMLVLFANQKPAFQKTYYWTNAPYERAPGCAWYQHFSYGNQNYWTTDSKQRARAVRRLNIK